LPLLRDPRFDLVRGESRFRAILEKLHFNGSER
jgi:hypothetical protein